MKTIRNRPRSSSSVPRNSKSVKDNFISRNRNESNNFDENESDDFYQKPKINPSRNSQWRKLRPPNFQSYLNNESSLHDSSKSFNRDLNSSVGKSKIDNEMPISKLNVNSSKRRSQSLNREKSNNKKEVKNNNDYDYDFYFNYQLTQSKQNDIRQSERRKNSINFDEFKNPDGSPRKLSQKFRHLKQNPTKNSNNNNNKDFTQFSTKPKQPFKKEDMLTPRKEDTIIRKKRTEADLNSTSLDSSIPSNSKDKFASTPNLPKNNRKANFTEINDNKSETEQVSTSIEIAFDRIQKELKDKIQSNIKNEAKPVINKKKKSLLEQKQQNQTTIDFTNYKQVENEQKNKSVIQETKPHVQFIDSVKPPKKKEFVPTIVESNVEKEQKSFVEPTKSDFNKKIEFPPDYMKNIYSSFMNSPSNQI